MNREAWLRQFHDAQPGCTARAFARSGSYDLLAAQVRPGARVLDLACGDGFLATRLPHAAAVVGVDISRGEALAARGTAVVGRAQALPFRDAAFDAAVCHLAFMLFDDLDTVAAELARVVVPGGAFHAVLGGGPPAHGDDAFHRFLAIGSRALATAPRFGDPRARSEAGWAALFADWQPPTFTRHELDLAGPPGEVWAFLAASYADAGALAPIAAPWRAAIAELVDDAGRVPCRVVVWLASARR